MNTKVFAFILLVCWIGFFLFAHVGKQNIKLSSKIPVSHQKPSQASMITSEIQAKLAKKLTQKYEMSVSGDSVAMPGGIVNNLGLCFHVYRVLKKEEIRKILVGCVEYFVNEINSNEKIRPYLEKYPFGPKNITIGLIMYTSEEGDVYDPDIEAAFAAGGVIWYGTKGKDQEFGYKNEYRESFEDAAKLVQGQK
jgi:hypothetical protein